jgi:hypothetical protein
MMRRRKVNLVRIVLKIGVITETEVRQDIGSRKVQISLNLTFRKVIIDKYLQQTTNRWHMCNTNKHKPCCNFSQIGSRAIFRKMN